MADDLAIGEKEPQVADRVATRSDGNAFLAQLSTADYELFRPHLTSFQLTAGRRLQDFGRPSEQVIFPHGALVAMTMPLRDGRRGGGAILAGRDGMVGALPAIAAAPADCDAEVYVPGRAARMSAFAFRAVLDQSATIRRLIARYLAALMMQVHRTALCNSVHPVEARIARSLLDIQDRCGGSDIPLTQNTLAQMLGVQRTTINLAAGRLDSAGIISCRRGYMQVVHRAQLERHACECHLSLKSCLSGLFSVPDSADRAISPTE